MTNYASFGRPRRAFIDALAKAGCGCTVSRAELLDVAASLGKTGAPTWITNDADRRAGRAQYSVNEIQESPFYGESPAPVAEISPDPVVAAAVMSPPMPPFSLYTAALTSAPAANASRTPASFLS